MASLVLLNFAEGDARFALSALVEANNDADVLTATKLAITAKHAGASDPVSVDLTLAANTHFEIPKALLKKAGEDYRFLTVEELKDLARHEIEKIDAARRRLKERLADPIEIDPSTSLFGVKLFDNAEVRLSPTLADIPPTWSADNKNPVVAFKARRKIDLTYQGVTLEGALEFQFEIFEDDLKDLANALIGAFSFDIPAFRSFDLGLPKFNLPDMKIPDIDLNFDWPSLSSPSFLPLNFPKVPGIDLKGEWKTKPKISVSLSNDDLKIDTDDGQKGVFHLTVNGGTALIEVTEIDVTLQDGKLTVTANFKGQGQALSVDEIKGPDFLPLGLKIAPSTLTPTITVVDNVVTLTLKHQLPRIILFDRKDPSVDLHLKMTVEYKTTSNTGGVETTVSELAVISPYPIELIKRAAGVAEDVIRFVAGLKLPELQTGPDKAGAHKVLDRLIALLAAAGRWLAEQAAGLGEILAGVAEAIAEAIKTLFGSLPDAPSGNSGFESIAVDVRLDPNSWRLRQLIVMPAGTPKDFNYSGEFFGFELNVDGRARPALVLDAVHNWYGLVLLPEAAPDAQALMSLGTDLWLDRDDGPRQPVGTIGDDAAASDTPPKLLQLTAKTLQHTTPRQIVLAAFQRGNLKLFQTVVTSTPESLDLGGDLAISMGTSGPLKNAELQYSDTVNPEAILRLDAEVSPDLKQRAFAILPKPSGEGGAFKSLTQRIKIEDVNAKLKDGQAVLSFKVTVKLEDGFEPQAELGVAVSLRDLSARITGGSRIGITTTGEKSYNPLGLNLKLRPEKPKKADEKWEVFALDLSRGAEKFVLGNEAVAELTYKRVSTSGRGLIFRLDDFAATRSGFDIDATITREPVTLGGVDVPFRFTSGKISIKGSDFQSASLAGAGQLPPALVGEANASIAMQLGKGPRGDIEVLGATARLDKSGDPIRCNATMFELTITELGFDFVNEGSYHFYFLLTGSAVFRPSGGVFDSGLLKNFKELEVKLDKAPLGGDPRVLMRSLSFLVKVDPPKRTNFFDLFSFDLRGIAFYPASPKFGGDPAMGISGKVNFSEIGDVPSLKLDFHQLYIAGPAGDGFLPRVRFDGLTVALKNGAVDVEATAIAVDDSLPDLYRPDVLPANVRADGFLASGRIDISGWATMSGAMGFLQLSRREGPADPRHAFFVYGQLEKQTVPIDTPVGTIYLREYGFGFGYRYTLAGIAQAETASSPRELIRILDEVSKYQGNLNSFEAWEPTYDNSDLTLALRGMFSIAAVRGSVEYQERGEKDLANPLLFDIVVALRTDLTFLINLRGWVATNYNDWVSTPMGAAFKSNPTMRGYLYFSVPRKEFLARMIAEPGGHVGNHPPLPAPLKTAIQATRFASTLYIRPGLFHMEFGWPYELGFDLGKPSDNFYLKLRGGLINRIEDFSLLYGMAFKAVGAVQFGGRVGNDNFGASATARADFAVEAKIIAYLSLKRFNDTLFYGLLRFDMTIGVRVSVWLSFKIFRKRIRLSAGFSIHLAVSIGLEAVITPHALGGRAHVAVGIRAFGRTLSVGIGLSFNDGLLNQARARVARFQALGLTAEIPPEGQDGRRAERAPRPDPPRKELLAAGDARIDEDLATLPPPVENELAAPEDENYTGRAFSRTDFWAMLFPVLGSGTRRYVLQLVPRDGTRLKREDAGSAPDMFYASPKIDNVDGKLTFEASHVLTEKKGDVLESLRPIRRDGLKDHIIGADFTSEVGVNHIVAKAETENAEVTVGGFLSAMFLQRNKDGSTELDAPKLSEPRLRLVSEAIEVLEDDAEASADRLGQIGRSRAHATGQAKREAEIEESRSAMLASVMETAEATARGIRVTRDKIGKEVITLPPAATDFDARDLGLTFLIDEEGIDRLFEAETNASEPRLAKFSISKSDRQSDEEGSVHLFNPPERMFRRAHPRLEPTAVKTADGIKLDWDLEPAWSASASLYDDPEQHLKYYRISRRIVGAGDSDYPAQFTVKAATPLDISYDGDVTTVTAIRAPYQFVDDLRSSESEDGATARPVPDDIRNALLGLAPSLAWSPNLRVQYDILPVDIAGTFDAGEPFLVDAEDQIVPPAISPIEATLQIVYAGMPSLSIGDRGTPIAADGKAGLRLMLVEPPEPKADPTAPTPPDPRFKLACPGRRFALRIWRDRAAPSGGYGADAVTASKTRPGEEEISALSGNDVSDFVIVLKPISGKDNVDILTVAFDLPEEAGGGLIEYEAELQEPNGKAATTAELRKALTADLVTIKSGTITPPPGRSASMYLRSLPHVDDSEAVLPGEWRSVSTNLVLLGENHGPRSRSPMPVDAVVEEFEQPVALDFAALERKDMQVRNGRLHVFRPEAQATFEALFEDTTSAIRAAPDPARRTATRLRWNARPGSLQLAGGAANGQANPDLFRWLSGFDVYRLDPDILTGDASDQEVLADAAEALGSVRMLPASERGLTPSGFGDMGRLETIFPSAAWRNRKAEQDRLAATPQTEKVPGRKPWFSLAESTVTFPRLRLRRSLLPDPDEALVSEMFAEGRPDSLQIDLEGIPAGNPLDPSKKPLDGWRLAVVSPDGTVRHKADAAVPWSLSIETTELESRSAKEVRAIFSNLVILPIFPDDGDEEEDFRSLARKSEERDIEARLTHPDYLEALSLTVKSLRDPEGTRPGTKLKPTASVNQDVDLLPQLHPILADTMSFLAMSDIADARSAYPRYALTPDDTPNTDAEEFIDYLEEIPTERDPHGFSALRMLGLAAGFQLFDTETGTFLRGRKLFKRVAEAFERARLLYRMGSADPANTDEGLPFADILTRPWGNARLFWFDGGQDSLQASDANQIVDDDTLAVMQISLRPMPDRLVDTEDELTAPEFRPVIHKTVRRTISEEDLAKLATAATYETPWTKGEPIPRVLRYRVSRVEPPADYQQDFLVDLVPQASGLESLPPHRMTRDAPGATFSGFVDPDKLLANLRLAAVRRHDPDAPVKPENVRLSVQVVFENVHGQESAPVFLTPVEHFAVETDEFDRNKIGTVEAGMGRFAELNDHDWADVLFRPSLMSDASPGTIRHVDPVGGLKSLLLLAARRFREITLPLGSISADETGAPVEDDTARNDRAEIAFKLALFSQRFLEHCAVPPDAESGLNFSLGTVADPGSWSQAPDSRGRVSIVIPDTDRRGARRAFAVRPTGRYSGWAEAAKWRLRQTASGKSSLAREDAVQGLDGALPSNAAMTHFVHTTLPRTEPLEKPVILAARRIADNEGLSGEGRFEIAVAHPPDMTLGAANRRNQALLAPGELSVGLWREFPFDTWLAAAKAIAEVDEHDWSPLAGFGTGAAAEAVDEIAGPSKSVFDRDVAETRLENLRSDVPDAWTGTTVFAASRLPYFFRTHMLVHVAAGIVVSDHAKAVFDEGFPLLSSPAQQSGPKEPTAPAHWTVVEDMGKRLLSIDMPLVRFIDAMSLPDATLWFGTDGSGFGEFKPVAHIPEPYVNYRIAIETLANPTRIDKTRTTLSQTFEIDIMPLAFETDPLPGKQPLYSARTTGQVLASTTPAVEELLTPTFDGRFEWRVTIRRTLTADSPGAISLADLETDGFDAIAEQLSEANTFTFGYRSRFAFPSQAEAPSDADWPALFDALSTALKTAGMNRLEAELKELFGTASDEARKAALTAEASAVFWKSDAVQATAKAFFGQEVLKGNAFLIRNALPLSAEIKALQDASGKPEELMRGIADSIFGANRRLAILASRRGLPPLSAIVQHESEVS